MASEHSERQPAIARQLDLARKTNTEDAWWAVLLYFEGNGPEKHFARQELIPRLFQQQRITEAERLCDEVLKDNNAPDEAKVTAWAGRALSLALQGRLAGFVARAGGPLTPGLRLFPPGDDATEIGSLTSAGWSFALERPVALGYLKRGSPMGELLARDAGDSGPGRHVFAQELPLIS